MGAWGAAAWDNDGAADWFGDMFDATGLAKHVEKTLNLDADDNHAEIHVTTYVLVTLGRNYIWPVDDLDRHLALAIWASRPHHWQPTVARHPECLHRPGNGPGRASAR